MRWGKDPEPHPKPPAPQVDVHIKDSFMGHWRTIKGSEVGLSRGGTVLIIHGIREEDPNYDTGVDVCIPLVHIKEWTEQVLVPKTRTFRT